MKEITKRKKYLLPVAAAAAVGGLYLLYYAFFGFYPFGERSIAWCDMEQQYLPLLMELRRVLKGSSSLLLGQGGAGMSFWGVFLFFVSSPIGFLSVFVSESEMAHFMNILTVIKLALAGSAAELFFMRIFPNLSGKSGILLSMMYSFSGYAMMYYQNNMWLDMMILFPILLLSLIRLAEDGKWIGFTLCLSISMYLNFYISFMVVLFSVIFFSLALKMCCQPQKRGSHAARFIAADLCAAMISAVVWLPVVKQLSGSGRSGSTLSLFRSGDFFSHIGDKAAMLACTGMAGAAAVLIIFRRGLFRKGRNFCFAAMLAILLLSAIISPINKIWHTGSYQAYPLRYGFMLIFMALCAAAALLSEQNRNTIPLSRSRLGLLLGTSVCAVIAAAAALYHRKELVSYTSSLWTADDDALILTAIGIIFSAAFVLAALASIDGGISRKAATLIMTVLMICESTLSFGIYFSEVNDSSESFEYTEEISSKIDDDNFCRLKSRNLYYYSNLPEGMGFSALNHYTSLTKEDWLFGAKRLGFSAYWMDVSSDGGTAVSDAFLMNKYVTGGSADMNGLYESYKTDGIIKIYKNSIVSDGAVISGISPEETKTASELQRMENADFMANALYGAENIVDEIGYYELENTDIIQNGDKISVNILDPEKEALITYKAKINGEKELYFDIFGNYSTALEESYFKSAEIYCDGRLIASDYPKKRQNGILDLGTYSDKTVTVQVVLKKSFTAESFGVYTLDTAALADRVNNTPTANITVDGNKIRIKADGNNDNWVYIPFVYDEGFRAEINGRKARLYHAFDCFMAVELENGENEIVLTFIPEGFAPGIVICIIGILLLIVLACFFSRHKLNGKVCRFAEVSVMTAGFGLPVLIGAGGTILWIILQFF